MTLFGICAQDYFSRAGHELLDWLGFIFDPADVINFLWYTAEGNTAMAAATAVAIIPLVGSVAAKGTKLGIKAGKKATQKATEKAAKNATEKAAKKAAKKKLAKEATEKGAEKAAKEAAEKATEKTAKEAVGDAAAKELKDGKNLVPDDAKKMAKDVKTNNGTPPKGYKGGKTYKNIPSKDGAQKLPEGVNYKEYDIKPYVKGQNRGAERIVIGDDGSVWYTNDHYVTFIQVE